MTISRKYCRLDPEDREQFSSWLCGEEKSRATVEKYLRDTAAFCAFAGEEELSKDLVLRWKASLCARGLAPRSVNSMLASVNALLRFAGREDCRVKNLRVQKSPFCPEERELTKKEYFRLLNAARKDRRLELVLQTICATGIRVSELGFFTVEAVRRGKVAVACKGKYRVVLVPPELCKMLSSYAKKLGISSGPVFCGKNGKPLNRSCVWRGMKRLCACAGVKSEKVFPHNLRKLFARIFYGQEKDIARLADVLGHSSIDTTRIYIMTSGAEHSRCLERMGLLLRENKKTAT